MYSAVIASECIDSRLKGEEMVYANSTSCKLENLGEYPLGKWALWAYGYTGLFSALKLSGSLFL